MAPQDLRAKALADSDLPEPLATLVGKVANRSFQISEADLAAAGRKLRQHWLIE